MLAVLWEYDLSFVNVTVGKLVLTVQIQFVQVMYSVFHPIIVLVLRAMMVLIAQSRFVMVSVPQGHVRKLILVLVSVVTQKRTALKYHVMERFTTACVLMQHDNGNEKLIIL